MLKPTIGRVVLFHPAGDAPGSAPRPAVPALVCFVHNNRLINVGGFNEFGFPLNATSVPLLQDDDPAPASGAFAVWPIQREQTAKVARLEDGES